MYHSVKFSHLSLALMMLFDLGNKLILYICHYQTPCSYGNRMTATAARGGGTSSQ
jgi:hypothetical protein